MKTEPLSWNENEQMELFREEFDRKERLLSNLNKENGELVGKLQEMQMVLEECQHKLEGATENQRKLEAMEEEMAENMEELVRENEKMRGELEKKEQNERQLKERNKKMSQLTQETELALENHKKVYYEKEKMLFEQLESSRANEKILRQENSQLKFENSKLIDQMFIYEKDKEQQESVENELNQLRIEAKKLRNKLKESEKSQAQKFRITLEEKERESQKYLEQIQEMQDVIIKQSSFISKTPLKIQRGVGVERK